MDRDCRRLAEPPPAAATAATSWQTGAGIHEQWPGTTSGQCYDHRTVYQLIIFVERVETQVTYLQSDALTRILAIPPKKLFLRFLTC